jgi:hypothetical protein
MENNNLQNISEMIKQHNKPMTIEDQMALEEKIFDMFDAIDEDLGIE